MYTMSVRATRPGEHALNGACEPGRFARSLQGRIYGGPGNAYPSRSIHELHPRLVMIRGP